MNVTACLVTRGNIDLFPVTDSFPPGWEVVVWDNSVEFDHAVYGRYAAIGRASNRVIYTQDDDCVLTREALLMLEDAYEPGVLVANMPLEFRRGYRDSCLVGLGSMFGRELPGLAFERFRDHYGDLTEDDWRLRCDVMFASVTPIKRVDLPVEILGYAYGDDRMHQQPGHYADRHAMLKRGRRIRGRTNVKT